MIEEMGSIIVDRKLVIGHVHIMFREDVDPRETELTAHYLVGYARAVTDYGIWKDGSQTIGCMGTDPKDAIVRKAREFAAVESVQRLR
jgi:hypothetical protein